MRSRVLPIALLILIAITLLLVIPASAARSTEADIDGTLTRGSRFSVTITGLPNTSYYIWLPRTFTMTGERYDQPPVIIDSQQGVSKDPEGGPYVIGSYQYYNGDGRTILDDVAPSTATMSCTNYYAKVITDKTGVAVVEFTTSAYTGLREYSVKVENPDSADSDRLLVDITLHVRRAPTMAIGAREETMAPTPVIPITTETTVVTTVPTTTELPTPVPTTTATPVPTKKAPMELLTVFCAAGLALYAARRQQ